MNLIRGELRTVVVGAGSFRCGLPVQANYRVYEQAEPVGMYLGAVDVSGHAGSTLEQHLLQCDEVLRVQRVVAALALQCHVVLVLLEVGGGLGAEAFPVGVGGDAGRSTRVRFLEAGEKAIVYTDFEDGLSESTSPGRRRLPL